MLDKEFNPQMLVAAVGRLLVKLLVEQAVFQIRLAFSSICLLKCGLLSQSMLSISDYDEIQRVHRLNMVMPKCK